MSIIRQFGSRSPAYYELLERYPEDFQEACNAAFAKVEAESAQRRGSPDHVQVDEDGPVAGGRFVCLEP